MLLTLKQRVLWALDRARQEKQHPADHLLRGSSRGDHYQRRNNGIAYRTFRAIRKER